METRALFEIAEDIRRTWKAPHYAAVPYLEAMGGLLSVGDVYGFDSAKSIVLYFLSNASTWRGADARRIKSELKLIVGAK